MPANLLRALKNIASYGNNDLGVYFARSARSQVRINVAGEKLEFFVKDAFCDCFNLPLQDKERKYSEVFSWSGNQNNPPDAILRNGDAFEIKKMDKLKNAIQLNSSPPKDKCYSNDSRMVQATRDCEDQKWTEKDLFYVVGATPKERIKYLFFVQGTCYAAKREVYERIEKPLKKGIEDRIKVNGIEGGNETNELGRINRVDPLGITNLRIRGMWTIQNPIQVFEYVYKFNERQNFSLTALMLKSKFDSYPTEDIKALNQAKIKVVPAKIKDPNNRAKWLDAQLITSGW
jgi:hypothetical protein